MRTATIVGIPVFFLDSFGKKEHTTHTHTLPGVESSVRVCEKAPSYSGFLRRMFVDGDGVLHEPLLKTHCHKSAVK